MKKKGEHFNFAMILVFVSIAISLIGFMSEDRKITGYVVSTNNNPAIQLDLRQFDDFRSLQTLGPGNYYIGSNGIVYWADDSSRPAVGKLNLIDDSQKNKRVYIDNNGNIGYILQ